MQLLRLAAFLLLLPAAFAPLAARPVTEAELRKHIEVLASDDFEGRAPGTEGERKTLDYLRQAWAKAGVSPGATDGSWLQPVEFVRRGPDAAQVQFYARGDRIRVPGDEILLVGKEATYTANKLPVIFVGHGVDAQGEVKADVKGKLALLLSDAADFLPSDLRQARARRQKLIAAGAEGVITISGEQFDFPVYRRSLLSRPLTWTEKDNRAAIEGAIGRQYIVALVTAAGGDWDKVRAAARSADYEGQSLALTVDLDVKSDVERFKSSNIIGKLPGKKPAEGAVILMAHWDHLGICRPDDDADRICNGAVDNASGLAVVTEVARRLARKRHDRDIFLVGTTAEESGLYGAYAFVANPVVPLDQIRIVLNIDTSAVAPPGAKVAIIGRGKTGLDSEIEAIIKKARRRVDGSNDANAFLQRQDGWAFTQKNVPAFMISGAFGDAGRLDEFLKGAYHGPDDEVNAGLQLGGAAEDADLHILLAQYFADARKHRPKKPEKGTGEP
jgi:hypothetical protein